MSWIPLTAIWEWMVQLAGRIAGECEKERAQLRDKVALLEIKVADLLEELATLRKLQQIGTIICDHRGIVMKVNSVMAEMAGYDKVEDLIGQSIKELIPWKHRRDHDAAFKEVVEMKRFLREDPYEAEMLCKDGTLIQILISLALLPGEDSMPKIKADIRRRW